MNRFTELILLRSYYAAVKIKAYLEKENEGEDYNKDTYCENQKQKQQL